MKQRIYSIVEAFSIQPQVIYIGSHYNKMIVSSIVLGAIQVNGDPHEAYFAYDDKGNIICNYLKQTVNVFYYPG